MQMNNTKNVSKPSIELYWNEVSIVKMAKNSDFDRSQLNEMRYQK